jgi:hypothetical protein
MAAMVPITHRDTFPEPTGFLRLTGAPEAAMAAGAIGEHRGAVVLRVIDHETRSSVWRGRISNVHNS